MAKRNRRPASNTPAPGTNQAIADSLLVPAEPVDAAPVVDPVVPAEPVDAEPVDAEPVDAEPVVDPADDPESSSNEGNIDQNLSSDEDDDDVEGNPLDNDDDDPEGDGGQPNYADLNDDDLIEVKVDGQMVQFTLGEAAKALSVGGAAETRLQEATELRNQANAEQAQGLERLNQANQAVGQVLQAAQQLFVTPFIKEPDEALRTSNPTAYLAAMDEYNADQQRVANTNAQLSQLINAQKQAMTNDLNAYRQEQASLLVQAVPDMKDKEKSVKLLADAKKIAIEKYGFSEAEVANAADHRMYRMMLDLSRFYAAGKNPVPSDEVTDLTKQNKPRPRVLRSGATSAKSRARTTDKQQKATRAKAKATGKVGDVAATLLVPAER